MILKQIGNIRLEFSAFPMNPRRWGDLRKHCGMYHFRNDADSETFGFYLDSDFCPDLRWQWCDEIASSIRHTGWYTDKHGDGDTVRGVVFRLPKNRGFLAGWSMGENMCGAVERFVYTDETDAAHAADSMAESIAENEREREYQEAA